LSVLIDSGELRCRRIDGQGFRRGSTGKKLEKIHGEEDQKGTLHGLVIAFTSATTSEIGSFPQLKKRAYWYTPTPDLALVNFLP